MKKLFETIKLFFIEILIGLFLLIAIIVFINEPDESSKESFDYDITLFDSVQIEVGNMNLHKEITKQLSAIIIGSTYTPPALLKTKNEDSILISMIRLPQEVDIELIKRYTNFILHEQSEYNIINDWHKSHNDDVYRLLVLIKSFGFSFAYSNERNIMMINHFLITKKYRKYDEVKLIEEQDGINGAIQIFIDNSLPENISSIVEIPDTLDVIPKNAIIRIVNDSNQVIMQDTLDRCLAWFDSKYLIKRESDWKALTIDYTFGIGSYNGPITSFIRVENSNLEWMTALNESDNTEDTVFLMKSLKTNWEISNIDSTTIYKKACRPNFENSKNNFIVIYSRYYLDDNRWKKESFSIDGFWESSVIDSNYIEKEFFSKFTY